MRVCGANARTMEGGGRKKEEIKIFCLSVYLFVVFLVRVGG